MNEEVAYKFNADYAANGAVNNVHERRKRISFFENRRNRKPANPFGLEETRVGINEQQKPEE